MDDSRDTRAGYIVTGDVTWPDGRRAHLHARLRLRIVDGEFQVLTEEFTLRPAQADSSSAATAGSAASSSLSTFSRVPVPGAGT